MKKITIVLSVALLFLSFVGIFIPAKDALALDCWGGQYYDPTVQGGACYDMGFFSCPSCTGVAYCSGGGQDGDGCYVPETCVCEPSTPPPVTNGACSDTHYDCDAGSSGSTSQDSSAWYWTCYGENGGSNDSCSEAKPLPAVDGSCSATHYNCNAGTSGNTSQTPNWWYWTCYGQGGGSDAPCSEARPVNGSCSATHYNCNAGTSTNNASGTSSWTWTCAGSNGGSDASCSETKTYTLSVGTAGSGSGTAGPAGTYNGGTSVTLTQTPASNSVFSSWSGDADCTDGSVTMNANKSCTANFLLMTGTLTPATTSCQISAGASSCNVTLTWSTTNPVATSAVTATNMTPVNGNSGSQAFTVPYGGRTFYLYNNAILLAQSQASASCAANTTWNGSTCATNQYTVTPSAGANGAISPNTAQTVAHGGTTQFTVTPNSGYTASVAGTCGGSLSDPVNGVYTYTTNAITSSCTVVASFAQTPPTSYTVTPSAGANGAISPNTAQTVAHGGTTQFTVTPNSGYTASVGGTCGGSLVGNTYTTNAITSSCTVVASFSSSSYTVTAATNPAVGAEGTVTPSSRAVDYGNTTTFNITSNPGYSPAISANGCSGSLTGGPTNYVYTTNPITQNCNLSVAFVYGMNGVLDAENSVCDIAIGSSSCTINLTWQVNNPVGPTSSVTSDITDAGVYFPNTVVATGHSGGPTPFVIPYIPSQSRKFYLYNNSISLADVTVMSRCIAGSVWNGSVCGTVPTLSSPSHSSVTTVSATIGANLTSVGVPAATERGTCLGTTPNPATNCVAEGGTSTGVFTQSRAGLSPDTTYYYRGYATNATGTGYSADGSFTTSTVPVMSATMNPLPSSCTIPLGASNCNVDMSWSITNPEGTPTAITASGMTDINVTSTLVSPQSGVQNVTVVYPERTFFLYNNSKSLVPTSPSGSGVTVSAQCAEGSAWNGSLCASNAVGGSLTPASSSCVITTNASSCTINFFWNTENPVATSAVTSNTNDSGQSAPNTVVAEGNDGGPVPFTVPFSNRNFYLYNNGVLLDQETVTSSCTLGTSWDGSKCKIDAVPLSLDLTVNGGDHNSPETALGALIGQTVYFSWFSFGNETLECWHEDGTPGIGWALPSAVANRVDKPHVVPVAPGVYEYVTKCREDVEFGAGDTQNKFAFAVNFIREAFAQVFEEVEDSVFVSVGVITAAPADPSGPGDGGGGGDGGNVNPVVYSGSDVVISWQCPEGSTASVGVNFDTGGAPSGSVTITPDLSKTYSIVCNDSANTGGSVNVTVTKRPFFIEN